MSCCGGWMIPICWQKNLRDAIADPDNDVLVSSVVTWEIAIKRGLGKLTAPTDLEDVLVECGFQELPISIAHTLATEALPFHHRDPFDRLLIAQAMYENASPVSRDAVMDLYQVAVMQA
jgi:PIN domain nuclease of toxin-antitoxin system